MSSAAVVTALAQARDAHDPIIVSDAPTFAGSMQRYLRVTRPGSFLGNAGGAMGWGLPAALGVKLARPDEQVICVSGDGSFWMVAQDLETAVREDIPVVVVITNNFAYGNTRDRQRTAHGGRYIGVHYDNPDFAAYAECAARWVSGSSATRMRAKRSTARCARDARRSWTSSRTATRACRPASCRRGAS